MPATMTPQEAALEAVDVLERTTEVLDESVGMMNSERIDALELVPRIVEACNSLLMIAVENTARPSRLLAE